MHRTLFNSLAFAFKARARPTAGFARTGCSPTQPSPAFPAAASTMHAQRPRSAGAGAPGTATTRPAKADTDRGLLRWKFAQASLPRPFRHTP